MENLDKGIDLANFDIQKEIDFFKGVKPKGYYILLRIYESPNKVGGIIIPENIHEDLHYKSSVGLVIALGSDCYKGVRFEESGAWCSPGEWVVIPRHEGLQVKYKNIPIQFVADDKIIANINSPLDIKRS